MLWLQPKGMKTQLPPHRLLLLQQQQQHQQQQPQQDGSVLGTAGELGGLCLKR